MNHFIKQNWLKVGLLAILVITIFGVFYWSQLRPTIIKKECWSRIEKIKSGEIKIVNDNKFEPSDEFRIQAGYGGQEAENAVYNDCLRENGL